MEWIPASMRVCLCVLVGMCASVCTCIECMSVRMLVCALMLAYPRCLGVHVFEQRLKVLLELSSFHCRIRKLKVIGGRSLSSNEAA